MKIILTLVLLLCFNLENFVKGKTKKSKSVTTLLDAKWEATPLVLEVAEYLADENEDFYWNFIDAISTLEPPLITIENDRERYDKVIELTSRLITKSQLSVLKLGLSLHIYSPKVQMFGQIAQERRLPQCSTVADVGGVLTCDLKELESLLDKPVDSYARIDMYKVDTHYPGSANRSLAVVLYGQLGTLTFSQFHKVLKQTALGGKVDYVVRHYVKDNNSKPLRLSGYGVELQMKSTEYKSQDDTEVHEDQKSDEATEEDEDVEMEGFEFSKLKNIFPHLSKELDQFKLHLEETSNELAPLKVWQFQELSLQASERIMTSPKDEALKVLVNIAQNFPLQAKGLAKTVVSSELKYEMKRNSDKFATNLNLQPSDTALFINGMFYDVDLIDIYGILEVLRQELRAMEGLHGIGISNKRMSTLLGLDFGDDSGSQEFAIDIRDSAINWMNDIEHDSKYARWSTSLMELLRPTFPGMLRQLRRNMYNLVIIIDPTDPSMKGILKLVESFVVHTAPIRVGLVFNVTDSPSISGLDDAGVAMQCALNYVTQSKDAPTALSFIKTILQSAEERVTVENVKAQLRSQYDEDPVDILGEDSVYDFGRQLSYDFVQRTGLKVFPQALLNGIPLPQTQITIEDFEEAVLQEIMSQTPGFQKNVYRGKLSDSDDVFDYIMNQPNVMPRLNDRILNKEKSIHLDMSGTPSSTNNLQALLQLSSRDMTATAMENLRYFSVPKKGKHPHSMTYWIVGDLRCLKSRKILLDALENLKSASDVRVSFLPNVNGGKGNELNQIVLAALQELPAEKALNLILSLLRADSAAETLSKGEELNIPVEVSSKVDSQELNLKMLRVYCQRVLKLKESDRAVVANGRVLGPLDENEEFTADDFNLLERFSSSSYLEKINGVLSKDSEDDEEITSDSMMRIISLLISRTQTRSRFEITFAGDEHSVVKIPAAHSDQVAFDIVAILDPVSRGAQKLGPILQVLQEVLNCNIRVFLNSVEKNSDMPVKRVPLLIFFHRWEGHMSLDDSRKTKKKFYDPPFGLSSSPRTFKDEMRCLRGSPINVAFDIVAILDPVSRGAQKLGPILQVLQEVLNCNIRVFLNSVEKNSDMPVKSFYRFVLEPEVQFAEDGRQLPGPIARFNNMPASPLLTQNYHVPENWLVEVVRSVYDLDNIRLENVESNVHSEYELEYLLLEGHCFEQNTGSPPRGLQITLGIESQPVIVDTIVMANLGYFQLKANPGAWLLRLRQGRSADIYDIVSHDGSDTPENSTDIKVLISSLRAHIVKLRVQKKPDKLNVDLLSEDEGGSGIWNSIASSFTGTEEEPDQKLNIFSLASGHLYERFLRIMMLSVLKHTKTPVKFWFLKNYLSPQVKDFLPYMAKEYGFEYELVQYKWPRWLHQQNEKQRIIWGYKILFLDVLFPLDVKKIIFVDADQVVRADLKELQQLDLGGAPYGYTPFCESRKEMDGFRFWKHGYWRNHLQGRRYHISALYVVDLKRFRRIAAGDRLRGQYQALSQDPNSLSNLDQDLPNNMIHQVAIKSLPQEWLWCETWCDDASKEYAKTIDLCNNPMTKEAKLTAAVRILPEWKGYDDEIRDLQKRIDSGLLDTDPAEHSEITDKDVTDIHSEL